MMWLFAILMESTFSKDSILRENINPGGAINKIEPMYLKYYLWEKKLRNIWISFLIVQGKDKVSKHVNQPIQDRFDHFNDIELEVVPYQFGSRYSHNVNKLFALGASTGGCQLHMNTFCIWSFSWGVVIMSDVGRWKKLRPNMHESWLWNIYRKPYHSVIQIKIFNKLVWRIVHTCMCHHSI